MGLAVLYVAARVLGGYPLFSSMRAEKPSYRGPVYTRGAQDPGGLDDAGVSLERAYLESKMGGYDEFGRPIDPSPLAKLAEEEEPR